MNDWLVYTPNDNIYARPPYMMQGEKVQPNRKRKYELDVPHPKEAWEIFSKQYEFEVTGFNVTSDGRFTLEGRIHLHGDKTL